MHLRPRTNHGAVGARLNKPVVVHGLTRFLRNREAARRKDEEKEKEKEVFATGHKTSSRSGRPGRASPWRSPSV